MAGTRSQTRSQNSRRIGPLENCLLSIPGVEMPEASLPSGDGTVLGRGRDAMADRSDAAEPTAGSVSYVDPEGLHKNPAFTNVVVVEGPVRTVHVGGQNAVDSSGNVVGKGDV